MSVLIRKNSLVLDYPETKNGEKKVISNKFLRLYLHSIVDPKSIFTVLDLFKILELDVDFWKQVTGEFYLPDLLKAANSCKKPNKKDYYSEVLVSRYGEVWTFDNKPVRLICSKKNKTIEFRKGKVKKGEKYRKWTEFDIADYVVGKHIDGEIYGLDFSPLNKYLNARVKIDEDFKILFEDAVNTENKTTEQYLGKFSITVLEMVKALLNEFTFYGTEENKKEKWKEIKKREEDFKKGNGETYRYVSFNEKRNNEKK